MKCASYGCVLSVDGTEFTSHDKYPKDDLDRLAQGGLMEITYVKLNDGSIFVWEIESIP